MLSNREGQHPLPILRRGRDTEKAPLKSVSTWIRSQKKEPRALIELGGYPFLSITRIGERERKVEQERAKQIDNWTEWKRETGNKKFLKIHSLIKK
jgi:hypothetical protein